VFGLSFGEFMVLLIVSLVVLGPKDLPRYLRKAGQFAAKIRRMAIELREKSGIDEVLRSEGIDKDIAEIRKLTRGELASVVAAVRHTTQPVVSANAAINPYAPMHAPYVPPPPPTAFLTGPHEIAIDREREYPSLGADAHGALSDAEWVPDVPPAAPLAVGPVADDPPFVGEEGPHAGDANGVQS